MATSSCSVGPPGSGKTTSLNLIGGLDTPTRGRVWVGGTETGQMSKSELSEIRLHKIGFVFRSSTSFRCCRR